MLLKNISLISLVIAVLGYATDYYTNIWYAPLIALFYVIVLVAGWFLICFICTRFIDMKKIYTKNSRLFRYFTNRIIGLIMQVLRVKLKVVGKEKIPKERFLFVSNHKTLMDPMAAMLTFSKIPVGFVAKKVIFKIPMVNRLMYRCFCLSLDRDDIKQSAKVITRASENIKQDICSMGIYPEGIRNRGDELLPFMNGAFKIAKKAGCPILVGVIKNPENILKNFPFRKTEVTLELSEVIDAETVKLKNTAELSHQTRAIMEESLT